ncbi:MAG: hypothetical protein Q8Q28_15290, partial [Pseudomonadota bacterium]|nr:hypothetical protein [Pseudomonadota bacterium]
LQQQGRIGEGGARHPLLIPFSMALVQQPRLTRCVTYGFGMGQISPALLIKREDNTHYVSLRLDK